MDEFIKRLTKEEAIGLDMPIFIYFLEDHPRYGPLAQITINGIEKGKWQGCHPQSH